MRNLPAKARVRIELDRGCHFLGQSFLSSFFYPDEFDMKSPLQAMRDLLAEDTRFKIEAYQFIRESLQYAHEHIAGSSPGEHQDFVEAEEFDEDYESSDDTNPRHVTGQQLCESCRQYALQQYGYLAKIVLASWGIRQTGDFGDLVYNLIRIEQMRKSDTDRREDFDDVFCFDDAFEPEFEFVTKDED